MLGFERGSIRPLHGELNLKEPMDVPYGVEGKRINESVL
jgi:hypothetical protein